MKKSKLLIPIFICGAALATSFTSEASAATKVKAQKIVETEYGDTSIGILIPDRGMADPHIWIENGRLYAFCGHDKSWEPVNTWIMDRWELWSTVDLVNWRYETQILPTDTYIGDQPNCWAGDLCERDGKYYWFFSNRSYNTGVMVADKITGPYRDLLGKPLLDKDLTPSNEYDPEIYVEEDGEYHICFGAGTYYMAPLAKDMKSLSAEPKMILVTDKDGKKVGMGDKPTMFKRDGWYYLASGGRYAMSRELYGPYTFAGDFGGSEHWSYFMWGDCSYMLHETPDTNNFYRGIGLQPLYFNEDGTIHLANTRAIHPGNSREYTFEASEMGWHAESGTTLKYDKKKNSIKGEISAQNAVIESAIYLQTQVHDVEGVELQIRNETSSTKARVGLGTYEYSKGPFWDICPPPYDWSKGTFVEVDIEPNSKEMQRITIPISKFKGMNNTLMQVRVEPAPEATSGKWEIGEVIVK